MMRGWRLSVAYIGPKSRTERPRKTKIGTELAHVTRDSDTTFKVKRSKVNLQEAVAYCGGLPHSLLKNGSFCRKEGHRDRAPAYVAIAARSQLRITDGECAVAARHSARFQVKQAVRVATRYAPAALLPRGRSSASRAAEQTQRSSSFLRPIRSHGHRCTCHTR